MIYEDSHSVVQWGIVLGASLTALLSDLRTRRIPNALTFTLFLSGLVFAGFGGGLSGLATAFSASVLLALPYVLLVAFAGGGAGDAKLMGGIGAWLGLTSGLITLACVSLSGVLLAILHSCWQKRFKLTMARVICAARGIAAPLHGAGSVRDIPTYLPSPDQSQKLPYGSAIFMGTCVAAVGSFLQCFPL